MIPYDFCADFPYSSAIWALSHHAAFTGHNLSVCSIFPDSLLLAAPLLMAEGGGNGNIFNGYKWCKTISWDLGYVSKVQPVSILGRWAWNGIIAGYKWYKRSDNIHKLACRCADDPFTLYLWLQLVNYIYTGWWFGTFFIFPYVGNNTPNWLIYFRGVETTDQIYIYIHIYIYTDWKITTAVPSRG